MTYPRIALVAALCLSLSACGGGGGGGSGGAGGGNSFNITLDRSSVSFDYPAAGTLPVQMVTARWTGQPPATLFVGAQIEGDAIDPVIPVTITETQATFPLRPRTGLATGNYTGRVLMLACSDQSCNQRVGGTPLPISYTVNVHPPLATTSVLSLRHVIGAPAPTGTIGIAASTGAWTAASDQPWLTLDATSGTGPGAITVRLDTANVVTTDREAFVTVASGALSQRVRVSLSVVAPAINVVSSNGVAHFSGVNGSQIPAQTFGIELSDNAQADSFIVTSNQIWLVIDSKSSGAPGTFTAHVDPSLAPLASGQYQAQLNLTFKSGTLSYGSVYPATLALTPPTLSLSATELVLGGPAGRTFDQLPINVSLNTGLKPYRWTVTGEPQWMRLDRTSGLVAAAGQTVLFTPERGGMAVGTRSTTLTFTAKVNGDTVSQTLPVTMNIDKRKILVSETGVGLTSAPGMQRLTRTLTVLDSFGEGAGWSVSDDQPWLTAVRNGAQLEITADPTGLATNALYTATVTIASGYSDIESDRVRVGLWVGSAAPAARTEINGVFTHVEADPIRPYVYAHDGGTSVRVFNVHTGAERAALANVAPALGAMAVTDDGDTLFVHDTTNQRVVPIDLRTNVAGSSWPIAANPLQGYATVMRHARPNGVGVLLVSNGHAYRADNGANLGQSPFGYYDVTADGKHVFEAGSRYDIDYTDATPTRYSFESAGYAQIDAQNGQDTAATKDGSRVYSASGYPYNFPRYNGLTLTAQGALPGEAYPNNVEMGSDGLVHCASNFGGTNDVWIYDANGFEIDSFRADVTGQVRARTLQVSADGFLTIVSVEGNNDKLIFRVVN